MVQLDTFTVNLGMVQEESRLTRLLENTTKLMVDNIESVELSKLCSMINHTNTIKHLNLRFGDDRACQTDFFKNLLRDRNSIRTINAGWMSFRPAVIDGLVWAVSQPAANLTRLNIRVEDSAALKSFVLALTENKSLTDVTLTFFGSEEKSPTAFATAFASNQTIRSLTLRHAISGEGCVGLAESLKKNKALTHLDLKKNQLEDAAAVALGKMLEVNTTLLALSLSQSDITEKGLLHLSESLLSSNKTLTSLSLSGIECAGTETCQQISNNLSNCSTLRRLKMFRGGLSAGSRPNESLQKLEVSFDPVHLFTRALRDYRSLTYLKGVSCFTDFSLPPDHVVINCPLRHLELLDCRFIAGSELLEALLKLSTLQTLVWKNLPDYLHPQIGRLLLTSSSLTYLNLCKIDQAGPAITIIAQALRVNKTLRTLKMTQCMIDDESLSLIGDALKENSTLRELDLSVGTATHLGPFCSFVSNSALEILKLSHHAWDIERLEDNVPKIYSTFIRLVTLDIHSFSDPVERQEGTLRSISPAGRGIVATADNNGCRHCLREIYEKLHKGIDFYEHEDEDEDDGYDPPDWPSEEDGELEFVAPDYSEED